MPVYPSYDFIDVLVARRRAARRRGGRMSTPVVALIGRPNVGKSALFNRIVGDDSRDRVSEEAGTTRDRHFARAEWAGRSFWLVDTGGITDDPHAPMDAEIRRQVTQAIDEADLLLFVVDAKVGLHPSDHRVADMLRELAASRCWSSPTRSTIRASTDFYEFYRARRRRSCFRSRR